MIEMRRAGTNWQVLQDGAVVFTGTRQDARIAYARLMEEQLNAKAQTRRGGKRIYR